MKRKVFPLHLIVFPAVSAGRCVANPFIGVNRDRDFPGFVSK